MGERSISRNRARRGPLSNLVEKQEDPCLTVRTTMEREPMPQTRHSAAALRWLVDGPQGLMEARITPVFAVLIIHTPQCDGEGCGADCDAEALPGTDIATAWRLEGDDGVWTELARQVVEQQEAAIPQPPHEATADQRELAARAREVACWMREAGYFGTSTSEGPEQ
jgi:hypothetical protein